MPAHGMLAGNQPSPSVRIAHDSNMWSTNVTDGTGLGLYNFLYPLGAPIRDLRRFPKIIVPIGARCLHSFKAERKAHSNAMQLKRQRRRWANRPAKQGIFFAGNRLNASGALLRPRESNRCRPGPLIVNHIPPACDTEVSGRCGMTGKDNDEHYRDTSHRGGRSVVLPAAQAQTSRCRSPAAAEEAR
jgi:hypothetical protein